MLLCKYLLPILAIISLIFLISWLVTRQSLTDISAPTQSMFLSIAFLAIVFFNGVYQNGEIEKPYPLFLQWIVTLFLITTPIYSILSFHYFMHTVNLKYDVQIGSLVNYGLLILYNFSYAVIALTLRKPWMKGIQKVNIILAFVLIFVAFLTNNSWFNSLLIKNKVKLIIKPTVEQQYKKFQLQIAKSGLKWVAVKNNKIPQNAIILGFNKQPIYLCQNNNNNFVGYINNSKKCVTLINNTVDNTASYKIFVGNKEQLSWINNGLNAVQFYSGHSQNKLIKICRTIHDNHIQIGFANSYGCKIIVNNSVFDKTVFYQYLYLLYK